MSITEGEVFRNTTDETDFIVKKIVNDMVVLQSQDGKRQVLTGVSTLTSAPFYQKTEETPAIVVSGKLLKQRSLQGFEQGIEAKLEEKK